jgi:hypothetical protein
MGVSLNEPETLPTDLFKTFIKVKDAKINPPDTK